MDIKVNEDLCLNCRTCIKECIHNTELGDANHVDHNFLFCNQCLHCYAVCPNNTIEVEKNFRGEEISENHTNYDGLLTFLKKRRSVRHFKENINKNETVHVVVVTGYPVRQYTRTVFRDSKQINVI